MLEVVQEHDAGDGLRVAVHGGDQLTRVEVDDAHVLVGAARHAVRARGVELQPPQQAVVAHRPAVVLLLLGRADVVDSEITTNKNVVVKGEQRNAWKLWTDQHLISPSNYIYSNVKIQRKVKDQRKKGIQPD